MEIEELEMGRIEKLSTQAEIAIRWGVSSATIGQVLGVQLRKKIKQVNYLKRLDYRKKKKILSDLDLELRKWKQGKIKRLLKQVELAEKHGVSFGVISSLLSNKRKAFIEKSNSKELVGDQVKDLISLVDDSILRHKAGLVKKLISINSLSIEFGVGAIKIKEYLRDDQVEYIIRFNCPNIISPVKSAWIRSEIDLAIKKHKKGSSEELPSYKSIVERWGISNRTVNNILTDRQRKYLKCNNVGNFLGKEEIEEILVAVDQMIERHKKGSQGEFLSCLELRRRYDISESTLNRILRDDQRRYIRSISWGNIKHGIVEKVKRYVEKEIECYACRGSLSTYDEISEKFGVSQTSIYRILNSEQRSFYRRVNMHRRFKWILDDKVETDSRQEAMILILLDKYVSGFSIVPGVTYQIELGSTNSPRIDYVVKDYFFEWHPIVFRKGYGKFGDKEIDFIAALNKKTKRKIKKDYAHVEKVNYRDKRRRQLVEYGFSDSKLVVAENVLELYNFFQVVAERELPEYKLFRVEFKRLEKSKRIKKIRNS